MTGRLLLRPLHFVVLICVLVTGAHGQSAPAEPPAAAEWSDLLAATYDVTPDITYRRANNTDVKLDLYLPHDRPKAVPVVMMIHGGGWVVGNKAASVMHIMPYLELGFAAVNVEYRLAEDSPAPAAVEDCRCALRWVINHAAQYNFDINRIVVTGGSAGGHLALTTGLLTVDAGFDRGCTPPSDKRWERADNTVPKVAAIVNWFGITDVADLFSGANAKGYAIEWFGSMPDRDQLARRISPVYLVQKDSPPVLTVHGDHDTLVPYTQAQRLHEALTRAGVRNQLVTIPDGGHGDFSLDQRRRAMFAIRAFLKSSGIVQ